MPRNKLFNDYKKLSRLISDGTVFCAFDTETTGLYSDKNRIIELGAVKFDRTGIIDEYNTLINPECAIPAECSAINHITDDMVQNQPVIAAILPDFLRFAGSSVFIAHNANFDLNFMNAELKRSGLPPLSNISIDTLSLSRWAYPLNGHWKLQQLAQQFNISVKAAHRASDDARVCMEVFLRCIKDTSSIQQ